MQLPEEVRLKIEQEANNYAKLKYGDPAKMPGLREVAKFDEGVEDFTAGAISYAIQAEELRRENDLLHRKLKWVKSCLEHRLSSEDICDFITKASGEEGGENE